LYEPHFKKEGKFIIIRFSRIMKDYEELCGLSESVSQFLSIFFYGL